MKIKNLLLLGLLTMCGMNAFAADVSYKISGIIYHYDDAVPTGDAYVEAISGTMTDANAASITIPATIVDGDGNTRKVTDFGGSWTKFTGEKDITGLTTTLTVDITNIPAFTQAIINNFTNLQTLKLTGTVTGTYNAPVLTGAKALDLTGLTADKIKFDGMGAAGYESIKTNLETEFAKDAFNGNTAIKTVAIEGKANVGETAFSGATALTSFSVTGDAVLGKQAFNGATALTSFSATGEANIGQEAFNGASNMTTATLGGKAAIGESAFVGTKLAKVEFAGEATIGKNAYKGLTSLTGTNIKLDNVKSIGESAFEDCTAATTISVPGTVTSIGNNAFKGMTALTTVVIENDNLTAIGAWFEGDAAINNIKLMGTKIATIADNAFKSAAGANATLTINAGALTKIGASAFEALPIKTFSVDAAELAEIGSKAFAAYAKNEIDLSAFTKLATVADDSFNAATAYEKVYFAGTALNDANFQKAQAWLAASKNSLKEITFPDALTTIGGFGDFAKLESVGLPKHLTTIEAHAFENCSTLKSIKIKGDVKTIGEYAFDGCVGIIKIDFSGATDLQSIGANAFRDTKVTALDLTACAKLTTVAETSFPANAYTSVLLAGSGLVTAEPYTDGFSTPFATILSGAKTSLTEITLPAALNEIKAEQFKGFTALKSIGLPKAVATIGKEAFAGSGLESIKIKENVETIGESAFQGCENLAAVNLAEATALTEIGKKAFADCPKLTAVDFAGATALATIGESAFNGSGLTSVTITSSIKTIGDFAFKAKVESVDFTDASALTSIGSHAFDGATFTTLNLTGATALTTVANDAFPQNAYTEVNLADVKKEAVNPAFSSANILAGATGSLTTITFPADYDMSTFSVWGDFTELTSITLPADATEIPDNAFQGSNITSFEVGEKITRIGNFAFQGSKLESIDFSKATALTEIGDAAFANTPLTSVGLPKNLKVIPASAFEGSLLESVKIKSHVEKIAEAAFKNCAKLANVNFEDANALTEIEAQAFLGTALTTLDLTGATALTTVAANSFPANAYTSVKAKGTQLAYRDDSDVYHHDFDNIDLSGAAATLAEVTLPDGYEVVPASKFEGFTALESIGLPKAVTTIEDKAFFKATALQGIKIKENVKTIGMNAFAGCSALANVNLSEAAALTTIGIGAFASSGMTEEDAPVITSIAFPAALATISNFAFWNCAELADVDFSQAAELATIGDEAFHGTPVTTIDLSACAKLATVSETSFPQNNYTKVLLAGTALEDAAMPAIKNWINNSSADPEELICKKTLKEITLPAKVTTIPNKFLADFVGVTSVGLPKECTTIGSYAFAGSGLTAIKIRSKVEAIGSGAFVNCENLATVNFSEATSLETIGNIAFKNTAVAEVVIPENANGDPLYLGIAAFKDSKLKSFSAKSWAKGTIEVDGSFVDGTFVSDELFMGTKLNGIAIPATMTKIGDLAFADCKKLASVKFKHEKKNEKLEEIGDFAFQNCVALEALDLSNTKLVNLDSDTPFEGCTALATITFPETLETINSYGIFADTPIENFEAPNLVSCGVLFGEYTYIDEDTNVLTYGDRNKENPNTTLKTVKMSGIIPSGCFAFCTALESVEWLGAEGATGMSVTGSGSCPVSEAAFVYCGGLTTFTYMPENTISGLMVHDQAFIGCTPFVQFVTNSNYMDYVTTYHKGNAPINTTFGDADITKITTIQDKANANQFVAKYVNNGTAPVYIDANDAKVYSIYVDGDAAYFSACRTYDGKYVIQPQTSTPGWYSHVIIKTEEAKEVTIHRMFINEMFAGIIGRNSIAYDDVYDSQKDDDLALVQYNAMNITGGHYLYRLTNTSGQGFGFTSFTGSTVKEGQFFIACDTKPAGAGRLTTVWLDEDGNIESTDGELTGIDSVESIDVNDGAVYTLQGVRVDSPAKGRLYIQNGKKIIMK